MAQVMFEKFNTPAMCVANQALLSIYACGRTDGFVFQSGENVSQAVPVFGGCILSHAIHQQNFGGHDLTNYLMELLGKSGYIYSASYDIVRHIKENMCYVANDYVETIDTATSHFEKSYELPNGGNIKIGKECFQCPEALFQPHLMGQEFCGIHETIYNAIKGYEIFLRRTMFANIIISGGNTMFPGLANRVQKEIVSYNIIANAPAVEVKVHAAPSWIGGSVSSYLSQHNWITQQEYDETGPSIIYRKMKLHSSYI